MSLFKKNYCQLFTLIIILAIFMAGIISLRIIFENEYNSVVEFVRINPDSKLIFLTFFIVSSVLSFPTLPLNVLAGLLYGTWIGGGIVVIGAVIGSYLTYLLVRFLKINTRIHWKKIPSILNYPPMILIIKPSYF